MDFDVLKELKAWVAKYNAPELWGMIWKGADPTPDFSQSIAVIQIIIKKLEGNR